jgi:DeoR/GlpR family transcriptional regulator of sugar metabolism
MIPEKRRQEIVRLNQEKNGISIKELSEVFDVSSMTILRDIRILEKRKQLEIVRGGVIPVNNFANEGNLFKEIYDAKKRKAFNEKNDIAKYCAKNLIKEGQVIAIEGGSTASLITKHISDKPKVTVITNGLFALEEAYKRLPENGRIICTGGILERPYLLFLGPDAEGFFKDRNIDIAFISCVAFDLKVGPMDSHPGDIRLKQSMFNAAERKVLLIDKYKVGTKSVMQTVSLNKVTDIVTNQSLEPELLEGLNKLNIKIHLA